MCETHQLFLCPQVRYELRDGDELTFADVYCVYLKSTNKQRVIARFPYDVVLIA